MKTTSNRKGRFGFKEVLPGSYTMVVIHPEFKKQEAKVDFVEGKDLEIKLLLEPLLENPYEIVVKGKKEESVVTRYVLEQRTLETVPGTFGDPVRVVETLPGFARAPFGAGVLVIRGSLPTQSRTYIDGIEVPILLHFLGGPSIISASFMDSIEYYPGSFPVKYGDAVAGMINVEPKTERVEQLSGELDVNLINAGGYVEGSIGDRGSFRLGGRRSYIDAVIAGAMAFTDMGGTVVTPVYYDYQGELSFDIDDRNRIGLFYVGSHDALRLVTTADDEDDLAIDLSTSTDFNRLIAYWKFARAGLSAEVKPYFGFDRFTFETDATGLDARILTTGSRQEINWKAADWASLQIGGEARIGFADFSGQVPLPPNYYIPGSSVYGKTREAVTEEDRWELDAEYWQTAAYAELALKPLPSLRLAPGFRFEVYGHPGGQIPMWDPRITARWSISDDMAVKGGVGKFSQAPEERYIDEDFGNPDLDEQWAMHYSGGVEWRISESIEVDLVGFYVAWYDLVVRTNEVEVSSAGTSPFRALNDGFGRSFGAELILRHNPSKRFFGWISYTLSRSELAGFVQVRGSDNNAPDSERNELVISPFDQTHILNAVGSVKLGRGWETGARMRLVSGNPTTPVERGIFVGDSGGYLADNGPVNSTRLPGFFQIDVRIEKQWLFETWMLSAYLDVQNVTNHANTEFVIRDYRLDKSWNVPGIPIFPAFGVTGRF